MSSEQVTQVSNLERIVYNLRSTQVRNWPFPHFFCEKALDFDAYCDVMVHLEKANFQPMQFAHRSLCDDVPDSLKPLLEPWFMVQVLEMFKEYWHMRWEPTSTPKLVTDLRFIRDERDYKIGPHTDAPNKVVSLLFYLGSHTQGTSVFVPEDHQKTCPGGPHHKFDGFQEVFRAPFVGGSCFGFWKTENSWHGVPPVMESRPRNVLLYNIYDKNMGK